MEKLLQVEAARLIMVLDTTLRRWRLVSELSHDLFASTEVQHDVVFGSEAPVLLAYDAARNTVAELRAAFERAHAAGANARAASLQERVEAAELNLRTIALDLGRHLETSPQIAAAVRDLRAARILAPASGPMTTLIDAFSVYRDLVEAGLKVGAAEAAQRDRELTAAAAREGRAKARAASLQAETAQQLADQQRAKAIADEKIAHLEKMVAAAQSAGEARVVGARAAVLARGDTMAKLVAEIERLTASITAAKAALAATRSAAETEEANARRHVAKLREQLTTLTAQYDTELMASDTKVYDQVNEREATEEEHTRQAAVHAEVARSLAELDLISQQRADEREQLLALTAGERLAAIVIQARARGWLARRQYATMMRALKKRDKSKPKRAAKSK